MKDKHTTNCTTNIIKYISIKKDIVEYIKKNMKYSLISMGETLLNILKKDYSFFKTALFLIKKNIQFTKFSLPSKNLSIQYMTSKYIEPTLIIRLLLTSTLIITWLLVEKKI
jgi:hypothetical protein